MTGARRPRWAATVAMVAAVAFVVLGVLVVTGVTQPLDVAARDLFRPSREWTLAQARADILVEGLQPRVVAALLGLAGVGASLHQRSWVPLTQAAAIGFIGGMSALIAKVAVGRPDPGNAMTAFGGSFPSGHVVSVLVCLGGALIVLGPHPRWRHWAGALVLAAGAGMAHGMLIQSAHWLTDVAGGALLGISVLAAASAWGPGRRSAPRPEQQPAARRGASGSPDGGFRAAGAPRQP